MRIQQLHNDILKESNFEDSVLDFISSEENFDDWVKHLYKLDRSIGGIGIYNVNVWKPEKTGQGYATGTYSENRGIFRPLQYCAREFLENFIALDTRYLVYMSGAHIEGVSKEIAKKLENIESIRKPLGTVVYKYLFNSESLKDDEGFKLLKACLVINELYCSAKHDFDYETDETDDELIVYAHLFSYEEAAKIYFCCRIHGMHLMEWMKQRKIAPESFVNPANITLDEFLKVGEIWMKNLKFFNPEFAEGGKRWYKEVLRAGRGRPAQD